MQTEFASYLQTEFDDLVMAFFLGALGLGAGAAGFGVASRRGAIASLEVEKTRAEYETKAVDLDRLSEQPAGTPLLVRYVPPSVSATTELARVTYRSKLASLLRRATGWPAIPDAPMVPTTGAGVVDVFRQQIDRQTSAEPFTSVNLSVAAVLENLGAIWQAPAAPPPPPGAPAHGPRLRAGPMIGVEHGVRTSERHVLAWDARPWRSFLTFKSHIGPSVTWPSSLALHHLDRAELTGSHVVVEHRQVGQDLAPTLSKEYGLSVPLVPDGFYLSRFYSLAGRPLFMSGRKIAGTFVVSNVALDPATISREEFAAAKSEADSQRDGAMLGAVLCGTGAVICAAVGLSS